MGPECLQLASEVAAAVFGPVVLCTHAGVNIRQVIMRDAY